MCAAITRPSACRISRVEGREGATIWPESPCQIHLQHRIDSTGVLTYLKISNTADLAFSCEDDSELEDLDEEDKES